MEIKFYDKDNLVIGGGDWELAPFKFSKILKIGGGTSPSWIDIVLSGTGSLTLTNAISLNYVKLFGGTEQRNLPVGYTQLEYIQSSGSQYIDTERVPNNDDIIEQKFQKVGNSTTTCSWYGSMPSSSEITPRIGIGSFNSQGVKLFAGTNYTGIIADADTNIHTLRFQATGREELTYTLDGVPGVIDASTSATPIDMFEPAIELTSYLFARHGTNGVQVYDNEGTKIYYHREYLANGTLVLNMVPVKRNSDNALGMYDTVSGQFFTNLGTGNFVAGNTAVPTPDKPIDIVSNNGVIKYSPNLVNMVADNVDLGHYISANGVYSESVSNFLYVPYIKVQPNTTYTLSFSDELYYITISEYSANDGTGFIQRNTGTTGGNTSLTITTQATTNYIRFGSNPYGNSNTVTMEQVLAINWMLAKADTPQTYMPYGQIYTDGTTETVNVHTKNLFSGTVEQGGLGDGTGTETLSSVRIRTTSVPVKPNTQYNLSWATNSEMAVNIRNAHFYTASNTWISRINASTFTTPPNTAFVRFVWQHSDANADITPSDISNVQLELGSTATTYEPYFNGGQATAEMLLKVGDYQDVQSVLDGEVTRQLGVKVLNGMEEGWAKANNSFGNSSLFADKKVEKSTVFCSHFQYNSGSTTNIPDMCVGCATTSINTYFRYDTLSTVEQFQQWLSDQYNAGTPVIVVYPLATATTESVTGQPLTIQAGTNIVEITQASIDGLALEVSYKQQQ